MPELPEVETVRRQLAPRLVGQTIVRARRVEAPAGPKYHQLGQAKGGRILAFRRRGKFLLASLDHQRELIVHLGMTGQLSFRPPTSHVRAQLDLASGDSLYFKDVRRFGRFLTVTEGDYRSLPTLLNLGPEPLEDGFDGSVLFNGLSSRAALKTALLSQRPVAGVGNIYADEALWRVRLHPEVPAHRVSHQKADALALAIKDVLSESLGRGGTTIRDYRNADGGTGAYVEELKAYGREGEPCVRCDRSIRRIVVGARSTFFCPRCQRLPSR